MIAKYVNKQVIQNFLYNDLQFIENGVIKYEFNNVFNVNVSNQELITFAEDKIKVIEPTIILEDTIIDYQ